MMPPALPAVHNVVISIMPIRMVIVFIAAATASILLSACKLIYFAGARKASLTMAISGAH
jgi:hypothetical protein